MPADIYWVSAAAPYRLATAPRFRGGDWLTDEVRSLKFQGVDLVVSLLQAHEVAEFELQAEGDACQAAGIGFEAFPMPDFGLPESTAGTDSFVERLARALREERAVVIHCRQGIGRSTVIAAAVLVRLGWSADDALAAIAESRGRPVPDTPEQRAWVEHYAARMASGERQIL